MKEIPVVVDAPLAAFPDEGEELELIPEDDPEFEAVEDVDGVLIARTPHDNKTSELSETEEENCSQEDDGKPQDFAFRHYPQTSITERHLLNYMIPWDLSQLNREDNLKWFFNFGNNCFLSAVIGGLYICCKDSCFTWDQIPNPYT